MRIEPADVSLTKDSVKHSTRYSDFSDGEAEMDDADRLSVLSDSFEQHEREAANASARDLSMSPGTRELLGYEPQSVGDEGLDEGESEQEEGDELEEADGALSDREASDHGSEMVELSEAVDVSNIDAEGGRITDSHSSHNDSVLDDDMPNSQDTSVDSQPNDNQSVGEMDVAEVHRATSTELPVVDKNGRSDHSDRSLYSDGEEQSVASLTDHRTDSESEEEEDEKGMGNATARADQYHRSVREAMCVYRLNQRIANRLIDAEMLCVAEERWRLHVLHRAVGVLRHRQQRQRLKNRQKKSRLDTPLPVNVAAESVEERTGAATSLVSDKPSVVKEPEQTKVPPQTAEPPPATRRTANRRDLL